MERSREQRAKITNWTRTCVKHDAWDGPRRVHQRGVMIEGCIIYMLRVGHNNSAQGCLDSLSGRDRSSGIQYGKR